MPLTRQAVRHLETEFAANPGNQPPGFFVNLANSVNQNLENIMEWWNERGPATIAPPALPVPQPPQVPQTMPTPRPALPELRRASSSEADPDTSSSEDIISISEIFDVDWIVSRRNPTRVRAKRRQAPQAPPSPTPSLAELSNLTLADESNEAIVEENDTATA